MPSLVLGTVRKFQHRSFSRFVDIPEKPEGVDENNPLPLIGLRGDEGGVVGIVLLHTICNRWSWFSTELTVQ